MSGRTLAACIDSGRDNMTAVRLLAAILVVFGHSYVLAGPGMTADDPLYRLLGHTYSHLVGVMMFFTISGLLIALAWQRRPHLPYFLRARVLRILPALIVCVIACSLVLGALTTTWPVNDYFRSSMTWKYIVGNASVFDLHWQLPGVFASNPTSDHVNGSLWTLPVEAGLYLVVAAFGLLGLLTHRIWLANLVVFVTAAACLYRPLTAPEATALEPILVVFFVFGALCCINRQRLPLSTWLLLGLGVAAWITRNSAAYPVLLALAIAYATLWLAYVPRLPTLRFGDLSYGTYLWGFPIQQTLIQLFDLRNPWLVFALALPLTLLLAALSWRFVEQPALRWKTPRVPLPVGG
jgi:peptidoglycan/LPS O-acetylase OafA/YrhL